MKDILYGLRSIGLHDGDIVLLHSSLKSMGYVEDGQKAVIEAILRVIGSMGTLLVPTLTGKREDSKSNPPVFDVLNTPCWTGIIPETVRKMEASRRSCHPTHSISAIGYKKIELTKGHEKTCSPCDRESPYYKLAKLNGYILLLGVDQESNTFIHACEEEAGVPYHLQKDYTESKVIYYNGEHINVKNRLHEWNKKPTDFNKLDKLLYENKIMKLSKICDATARLIPAADMFDYTAQLLTKDPYFLLKDFLT